MVPTAPDYRELAMIFLFDLPAREIAMNSRNNGRNREMPVNCQNRNAIVTKDLIIVCSSSTRYTSFPNTCNYLYSVYL